MSFDYNLIDTHGRVVGSVSLSGVDSSYVLPDGQRCPMSQVFAWCDDCDGFVAAEDVPSVAEINEGIAAVHAGSEAFKAYLASRGDALPPSFTDERLSRFMTYYLEWRRLMRAWRPLRQSPPHCLHCGSTRVTPLPRDGNGLRHTATGQPLRVKLISHSSVSHSLYSVDGIRLDPPRRRSHRGDQ